MKIIALVERQSITSSNGIQEDYPGNLDDTDRNLITWSMGYTELAWPDVG